MHVGIIGAGASGLCSARHALANNLNVTLFEQAGELGGTWVYTDNIGTDQYGMPIHTSMYKGLRTNLPKEMMGFPDFPVPEDKCSYVPQKSILKFLDLYAQHFDIKKHIKYYNHVKTVRPIGNKWEIVSMDVRSKKEFIYNFDAVMVCNGHYNVPNIPSLKGISNFKGEQGHSHDYRSPEMFKDKTVLVIGAGPSGLDLAIQISQTAKKVILSHHFEKTITFPENIIQVSDVEYVYETDILFTDGNKVTVDFIFYCTGYNYCFPFLSEECGISVDDNYIKPLYKHIINIEHSTMGFIGIPFYVCTFHMFDLQARFFIATLSGGGLTLPSKQQMQNDTDEEMLSRWTRGYTKRQAHLMGPAQEKYYADLATMANLKPIPPVMIRLHKESMRRLMEDFVNYRNDIYRIIDENNFVRLDMGSCRCQTSIA